MKLNRTPSLYDRQWRNEENENWSEIEDGFRSFSNLSGELESFIDNFDGENLLEKSYNLFNKDAVVKGRLDSGNGELIVIPEETWVTSEFIPVEPGKRLQIKPAMGTTVMYDSDYNYVDSISASAHPMIMPNNVRYIRNTMGGGSIEDKYIYLGDSDLPYVEYGYKYSDKLISIIQSMIGSGNNVPEYVNLFDKNTVVEGNLSTVTGEVTTGTYYISDFIEVQPLKEIQLRPNAGILAVYDYDKNFIEIIPSSTTPKIIPSNGRYVRNRLSQHSLDGKYIYMGTEDMPYYPYGEGPGKSGGTSAQKEIKILGLGNSYSNDTFWLLKDIAESAGYKVTVGISHISGGTLSQVYDAINGNGTVTTYNKFTAGGLNARSNFNAKDIITDEDWDYIIMQQASTTAKDYSTYQPALGNIVSYLKDNATNSSVKLGMNMPWVRPISNSSIGTPEKQLEVNADIVNACQQAMFDESLDIFIPTGTAVMNGRSNEYLAQVSNELTRDGSHLDEGIGRYLAALTAFNAIFGEVADGNITYSPNGANNFHSYLSKISAKKAVIEPFEVTKV